MFLDEGPNRVFFPGQERRIGFSAQAASLGASAMDTVTLNGWSSRITCVYSITSDGMLPCNRFELWEFPIQYTVDRQLCDDCAALTPTNPLRV